MNDRTAAVSRETAETSVDVVLDIDGAGDATVDTGVGFLDHLLTSFATHGLFDLTVEATGDLSVGTHHTVEDVAITLGETVEEALGDKRGIVRFAERTVPMDEARATVVIDVSGRPYTVFEGEFSQPTVGSNGMTSQLGRHVLRSFATHAGVTLHATVMGKNAHHELEALFKGLARALDDATQIDDRRSAPPSTKGEL